MTESNLSGGRSPTVQGQPLHLYQLWDMHIFKQLNRQQSSSRCSRGKKDEYMEGEERRAIDDTPKPSVEQWTLVPVASTPTQPLTLPLPIWNSITQPVTLN